MLKMKPWQGDCSCVKNNGDNVDRYVNVLTHVLQTITVCLLSIHKPPTKICISLELTLRSAEITGRKTHAEFTF
jgi:hypothetical protein